MNRGRCTILEGSDRADAYSILYTAFYLRLLRLL